MKSNYNGQHYAHRAVHNEGGATCRDLSASCRAGERVVRGAGCGVRGGVAPDVGALVVALVGDWLATPCCGGGAVQIEPSLCPPFVHFLSAKPEV